MDHRRVELPLVGARIVGFDAVCLLALEAGLEATSNDVNLATHGRGCEVAAAPPARAVGIGDRIVQTVVRGSNS